MLLEDKALLLISPEPWGEYFVSKHHYAVKLASKGNKVFFLNPPTKSYSIKRTSYDQLWEMDYPGFPLGLRFYPSFFQKKAIADRFRELERIAGVSFDVVWSFDTSVFYDFSALPKYITKILHIVDLTQDFQTAKAASTANLCFGTTKFICERLKIYNERTYKIPHGLKDIKQANDNRVTLPGNGKLKALYMGNLSIPYIDWSLIELLVSSFPDIDFVFVGPTSSSNLSPFPLEESIFLRFKVSPNVHFIGAVPSTETASYLQAADILLITYLYNLYPEQLANPHKVMEYLATGRPIVATWTEEYADKNLLYMAKTKAELVDRFSWVVTHLEEVNKQEAVIRRQQFAKDNTYEAQLKRIESHIAAVVRK